MQQEMTAALVKLIIEHGYARDRIKEIYDRIEYVYDDHTTVRSPGDAYDAAQLALFLAKTQGCTIQLTNKKRRKGDTTQVIEINASLAHRLRKHAEVIINRGGSPVNIDIDYREPDFENDDDAVYGYIKPYTLEELKRIVAHLQPIHERSLKYIAQIKPNEKYQSRDEHRPAYYGRYLSGMYDDLSEIGVFKSGNGDFKRTGLCKEYAFLYDCMCAMEILSYTPKETSVSTEEYDKYEQVKNYIEAYKRSIRSK